MGIEQFFCLKQRLFSLFGGVQDIDALEVIVPLFDGGSGEEILLVALADDVLDDRLQFEVELSNAEELLEARFERVVVINGLDLRGGIGDHLAETASG